MKCEVAVRISNMSFVLRNVFCSGERNQCISSSFGFSSWPVPALNSHPASCKPSNLILPAVLLSKHSNFSFHLFANWPSALSMQAVAIINLSVFASMGLSYMQLEETEARIFQVETIAAAAVALLQCVGRPS